MKPTTKRKLHRRLGLVFCLFTLVASGSGIIHNVMSWTQPPPPRPAPAGTLEGLDSVRISPAEALDAAKIFSADAASVTLRMIGNEPWYQIHPVDRTLPRYVRATDSLVEEAQDERYAEEIASRHLGGTAVRRTDYLTDFNREYIEIYRILPVYRFDADDGIGTRVYVSTLTGSVTRHTDNHRQLQSNIFGLFHKFNFIPDKNIRNTVLTITTSGIFLAALSGLFLFAATMRKS